VLSPQFSYVTGVGGCAGASPKAGALPDCATPRHLLYQANPQALRRDHLTVTLRHLRTRVTFRVPFCGLPLLLSIIDHTELLSPTFSGCGKLYSVTHPPSMGAGPTAP
jgi:hypothetical protein